MNSVDILHALLFVADAPAPVSALAKAADLTEGQVEQALEILEARLEDGGPLQLNRIAGGIHLSTKPEYAPVLARFVQPQKQRLSRSLLETLAVVAYQQPMTMGEIEQVRGVQSDYSVRVLLERRLLREVGRRESPGRPILYGTTEEFLHQFNMNSTSDLPKIDPALAAALPALEMAEAEPA